LLPCSSFEAPSLLSLVLNEKKGTTFFSDDVQEGIITLGIRVNKGTFPSHKGISSSSYELQFATLPES
jgi:hypothetical protein